MTPLLRLWLPADQYVHLVPHIAAVLLTGLVLLPSICSSQSLMGLGRVGPLTALRISSAACGITMAVLGATVFHWGFTSVTVALCTNAVIHGLGNFTLGVVLTRRQVWPFIRRALLRPLAVGLPALAAAYLAAGRFNLDSWPALAAFVLATAAILAAAFALTLAPEDRRLVHHLLATAAGKLRGMGSDRV